MVSSEVGTETKPRRQSRRGSISQNPASFLKCVADRVLNAADHAFGRPLCFVGRALTLKLLVPGEFADTFLHRTFSFVAGAFDTVFVHHIHSPSNLNKPIITDLVQVAWPHCRGASSFPRLPRLWPEAIVLVAELFIGNTAAEFL